MKVGDMLQSNSYSALLRTDEWKRYSATIRRQRGNACECCRRTGVVTQVHHISYDASKKPWEHGEADVILLCAGCHKELHEQLRNFRRHVFRYLTPGNLQVLNSALAVGLTKHDPLDFVHAVAEMASSPGSVKRFAYAFNGGKKTEIPAHEYNATQR